MAGSFLAGVAGVFERIAADVERKTRGFAAPAVEIEVGELQLCHGELLGIANCDRRIIMRTEHMFGEHSFAWLGACETSPLEKTGAEARRTGLGRLLTDRHVLPPFNYGHSSARRRTQLVQRSMTAIFPSSWRSPAARVKLLSRSICSALSSMRSAAMFSSTRATRLVPGIGAMSPPCAGSQARAICAGVAPASAAMALTSSTMRRLRWKLSPVKRELVLRQSSSESCLSAGPGEGSECEQTPRQSAPRSSRPASRN